MKDIAKLVNLHHSTVSLALRDDVRLSTATREKVQAAARKLGYRPNPLVSALMSYRARRRSPTFQMELAFLCATSGDGEWLKISDGYRRMWKGARERAVHRGYSLNIYSRGTALTAKRFGQILRTRGIGGILIAPMPVASTEIDLDWSSFSVIELGFTLARSNFHRVVHDYFHAIRLLTPWAVPLGTNRGALPFWSVSLLTRVLVRDNPLNLSHWWDYHRTSFTYPNWNSGRLIACAKTKHRDY